MPRKATAHNNRYTREKKKILTADLFDCMSVDKGCNTLRRGVDVHVVSRDTPDALSIAGMFGTAKLWKTCLFTLMENSL